MKKRIYTIVIIFILIFCTASCSMQGMGRNTAVNSSLSKSDCSNIEVQTPMTLSNSVCTLFLYIRMINDTAGWAFNENQVFHTNNGGRNWKDVTPEMTGLVKVGLRGYFLNEETGWVVLQEDGLSIGNQGATSTTVFCTSNAGLSWNKSVIPSYNIGTSMSFIDSNKGWILLNQDVGMGKQQVELYQTQDGGKTWLKVSDTEKENGLPLGGLKSGISFSDDGTGWLTGSRSTGEPIIYKTNDGGKTWSNQLNSIGKLHPDNSGESLQPVFFKNGLEK